MAANSTGAHVWADKVTDTGSTQLYALGTYREEGGKGYRYFQFDNGTGNLTLAANGVLYFFNSTSYVLTSDVSDSNINLVAGVAQSAVADQGYGWAQVHGICTVTTNGDDDIAKGDAVIGGGDGTCNSIPAGTDTATVEKHMGFAMAADSDANNTVVVYLELE